MAAISLSPTPVEFPVMSSRRIPLSTNQNAANSPLRTAAIKQKRTLAQLQREEPYGQPPPAKKLVIDASTQRVIKSPSQQQRVAKSQIPVQSRRATGGNTVDLKLAREKAAARQQQQQAAAAAAAEHEYTEKDIEEIQAWKHHHRGRFSTLLFYFDQIQSDIARGLKRHITALGGREAAFFSVDVTHVITNRTIPTDDTSTRDNDRDIATEKEVAQSGQEQAATINPSLLTRFPNTSVKDRLFDADLRARAHRAPPQPIDQTLKAPKKAVDILIRARDMKKKIWTADKLFRFTSVLLETDPYRSLDLACGRLKVSLSRQGESRGTEDRNLLRLLQKERANGPSDRDSTVVAHEIVFFKGPYIYVYDVEEKQKPIMVKEYPKVTDKSKGSWPQFQTAALGRCPFIEDEEVREAREAKEAKEAKEALQKMRAKVDNREGAGETKSRPVVQPPRMAPPRQVTGKRTLGEMEQGHNRQSSMASVEFPSLSRGTGGENMDFSSKAFTSHAATGRLLAGEPVASGMQPSNVTSAIRSQMISSTATTPGVITGLSKEVHSLQRQVLKWHPSMSQDPSSRRAAESSFREDASIRRPPTLGRTSSRKLELVDEKTEENEAPEQAQPTKRAASRKKAEAELKLGYCENCNEKYAVFEEHIESPNHRKFANDDNNWVELDDLLAQLERIPKRQSWKPASSWHHSSEHEM
ncbi:Dfp1/Him1, central region-domain-containing protein [Xylaria scruposa]|nr:Dfp1/Him1, central region-domain-containing protein [Xylaria scruposa]